MKKYSNSNLKPNFVICAFPPQEIINFVNSLKEKYEGKKYSSQPKFPIKLTTFPHLTLKRKFTLKQKLKAEQIAKLIDTVCQDFKSLQLETGKIRVFKKPNLNTIYLEIKNNKILSRLVGKIMEVLAPISKTIQPELDKQFVPHITILFEISDKKSKQARKIFREKIPTVRFKISKLHFLKSSTKFEGKRQLVNIFNLRGKN